MFGRDPITPVTKLLEPRPRYYGERGGALKMDMLRRLYTIVVQNIRKARDKLPKKEEEPHKFKVNDMVLVKDPDAAVFEPRYQPNFRVTAIFGNNRIEVQDERGHKSVRSAHVKYIAPSEKVVKQLPSEQLLKNYGRSSKLLLAEKDIPDLHFDVKDRKEKGDSLEKTEVMEITDVNTGGMTPLNSDFREHSRNSLESAAGEELELVSEQRSVKQALDSELYMQHSECREHSQNSQINQAGIVEVTVSAEDTKCPATNSDFPEDSQNSLSSGKRERDNGEPKVSFGNSHARCLVMASEF